MTARLTPRQRTVVVLLAEGLSCPEIARRLGVRLLTVRAHVRTIATLVRADTDLPAMRRIKRHASELLAA